MYALNNNAFTASGDLVVLRIGQKGPQPSCKVNVPNNVSCQLLLVLQQIQGFSKQFACNNEIPLPAGEEQECLARLAEAGITGCHQGLCAALNPRDCPYLQVQSHRSVCRHLRSCGTPGAHSRHRGDQTILLSAQNPET